MSRLIDRRRRVRQGGLGPPRIGAIAWLDLTSKAMCVDGYRILDEMEETLRLEERGWEMQVKFHFLNGCALQKTVLQHCGKERNRWNLSADPGTGVVKLNWTDLFVPHPWLQ